jgi:hypothetical protein
MGLHVGFDHAFIGDATLKATLEDLRREAQNRTATDIEIVYTNVEHNFWRFFPLSILFQPVIAKMAANLRLAPSPTPEVPEVEIPEAEIPETEIPETEVPVGTELSSPGMATTSESP